MFWRTFWSSICTSTMSEPVFKSSAEVAATFNCSVRRSISLVLLSILPLSREIFSAGVPLSCPKSGRLVLKPLSTSSTCGCALRWQISSRQLSSDELLTVCTIHREVDSSSCFCSSLRSTSAPAVRYIKAVERVPVTPRSKSSPAQGSSEVICSCARATKLFCSLIWRLTSLISSRSWQDSANRLWSNMEENSARSFLANSPPFCSYGETARIAALNLVSSCSSS